MYTTYNPSPVVISEEISLGDQNCSFIPGCKHLISSVKLGILTWGGIGIDLIAEKNAKAGLLGFKSQIFCQIIIKKTTTFFLVLLDTSGLSDVKACIVLALLHEQQVLPWAPPPS